MPGKLQLAAAARQVDRSIPNGTFGPGANPARRCPDAPDPTKKVHGNDLDSDAPAIGYTLRDEDTLEVMKYGETTMAKNFIPLNI
ncbi:hypothetical protein [Pseudomonas lundensis]|uniref:hypothetical protein n=1 Tax=Pseudomonas lundensis TaxID=86185 RepID=UPI001475AB5E|nr:hypothetical protein [Pseudomonas lundensis]NNA05121.1 hypothetical protein [Pseudomonas lundensis]